MLTEDMKICMNIVEQLDVETLHLCFNKAPLGFHSMHPYYDTFNIKLQSNWYADLKQYTV